MTTISEMAARWRIVQEQFIAMQGEAMTEQKEQIVGVIVEQQNAEHVDSAGNPLRPYSPRYKLLKQEIGKSGETDFDLTGDFQSRMNLVVDGETFSLDSPSTTDEGELKSEWLQNWNKKGGSDANIMLPDEENKRVIWRIIRPKVVKTIADTTGCGTS